MASLWTIAFIIASYTHCGTAETCEPHPIPPGMKRDSESVTKGRPVTYSCLDGYTSNGNHGVIRCHLTEFTWSTLELTCTPPSCGVPPDKSADHMDRSSDISLSYEDFVLYTCQPGYSDNGGNGNMTCMFDGNFTEIDLDCTKALELVGDYGIYSGETKLLCTFNVGTVTANLVTWEKDTVNVKAYDGYTIGAAVGDTFTLTIEDTQSENLGVYTCSYGHQTGEFTLKASHIYALDVSTVVDKSSIRLQINHVLPQSLEINVTYNGVEIAGTIDPDPPTINSNSLTYGTSWTNDNRLLKGTYLYKITNGADLTEEGSLKVTECEDFYYGDCSDMCMCNQTLSVSCDDETGVCTCKSGWTGANCEQDRDECLDADICPKENDHCVNNDASYECVCNTGYHTVNDECTQCEAFDYGENCTSSCLCDATHADLCDHISGECECKDGWRGPDCTQDIDECAEESHNCEGNYRCIDKDGSFTCQCNVGYTEGTNDCVKCAAMKYGENCAMNCICTQGNTEECNNIHGTCLCKTGWDGTDCSLDYDECEKGDNECNTTKPNSHCNNKVGSYECLCNDGYETVNETCQVCDETHWGHECSQECTACTETNKNKCNPVNGNCSCNDGWQGEDCMVNVDECQPDNPCGEHGTCEDSNGGYTCTCNIGYSLTPRETYGDTCTECDATHWGKDCATECSCVVANTMDCNNVNGTCACKSGWENTNCETDVNECETNNGDCQTDTVCNNTDGSYECNCVAGYEKLANDTCTACDSTHYGLDCGNVCTCNVDHTTDCDNVNGACTCKNGWSGGNCTDNVDECTDTPDICGVNAICSDTDGGHECTCVEGWNKNKNGKCIDRAYRLSMKMKITADLADATVKIRMKIDIKASLTSYFQSRVNNFLEVIIDALRPGSVIADYRIITMDNPDALSTLTGALQDVVDGRSKIIYNNTPADVAEANVTAGVGINEQTVTLRPNGDQCATFLALHQCGGNYECALGENGDAECRLIVKSDNFELVVGFGVGIPLFLLALLLISLAAMYKNRYDRRNNFASRHDTDSGDFSKARNLRHDSHVKYFGRSFKKPYENRRSSGHSSDSMSYYDGGPVGGTHWQSIGRVFDQSKKFEIRRPKYRRDPLSDYPHL